MAVEVEFISQLQYEPGDTFKDVVIKNELLNEIVNALIRDMLTVDARVTTLEGFHP